MSVELALRAARVRYGPLEALHGVDLALPAGHLTVLLGRNGAGRTTALRALAGTVRLASGQVRWRGRDVTGLPAHARARAGLAFVPDVRAVFGSLTVAENLELAARTPVPARKVPYPALRPLLDRTAGTLSGGEQRMLAVARALLSEARVLLLDEPAQGMAPPVEDRTYALLHKAVWADGRTVALAAQRLTGALAATATVAYELRRGAVAFGGEPAELPGVTRPGTRPPRRP